MFGFRALKLGPKIDQKSIKERKQKGKRFEHRFLIDFGGFWRPSWEGKTVQNRFQKASKKQSQNCWFFKGVSGRLGVAPGAATPNEPPRRGTSASKITRPGAPEPPHVAPVQVYKQSIHCCSHTPQARGLANCLLYCFLVLKSIWIYRN